MRASFIVGVWVMNVGLSGAAEPPRAAVPSSSQPNRSTLNQLVLQLGDRDFRTRNAAQQELLAHGPVALEALKAGQLSRDPEVAERASELRSRILAQLENDRAIAGKTVHLDLSDARLQDVGDAIEKQTGYKIRVNGDQSILSKRLTFKAAKGTLFWSAVEALADAAGLEFESASAHQGPINTPMTSDIRERLQREEQLLRQREFRQEKLLLDNQLLVLQVQLSKVKALQAKAEKDAEKKALDEKIAALAGELTALKAKVETLEANYEGRREPTVAPAGTIVLRKPVGTAKPNPIAISGGFRIEARSVDAERLTSIPDHELTVGLIITPEPAMKWGTALDSRVFHATDLLNQSIAGKMTNVTTYVPLELYYSRRGLRARNVYSDQETTYQGSQLISPLHVRTSLLAPAETKSTILKKLEGEIRAKLWSGPSEVVSVSGFHGASVPVLQTGENSTAIQVKWISPTEEQTEPSLSVTLHYPSQEVVGVESVAPAGEVWLGRDGRPAAGLPLAQREPAPNRKARTPYGLTLTDADGKPYDLIPTGSSVTQQSYHEGRLMTNVQYQFQFKPVNSDAGPPTKMAWVANSLKDVRIPFAFRNVEVRAGLQAETPVLKDTFNDVQDAQEKR